MIVGFENYKSNYDFKVTGVIHAGAHFGQEYEEYINTFGQIETHWFEPLPDVYEKLCNNLKDKPGAFLYNIALGEDEKKAEINVDSGNDGQSSSILKPKDHLKQFPHIDFLESNRILIEVRRLDDIGIKNCNMLVMDTQGYELKVLEGAVKTFENIDYIFTEFNTIEMYEGCPKIEEIDDFLRPFGFHRRETWYTSGNWGDAFYSK